MFSAGDVVADYVVEELRGSGSSADVYRAHGPLPDGSEGAVALKVLTSGGSAPRARERFEREYTIASVLDHPNIVTMYTRGEFGRPNHQTRAEDILSTLWLAMQYVDGPPATAFVPTAETEPDIRTILRVATQVAAALDYAHAHDVLHRDVKPANILLDAEHTTAYLSDFGIAQFVDDIRPLARNGRVQGSIAYAPPELLQAQQLSPSSDVYAFSCALVELLTGAPPFPRPTAFAITRAHISQDPPRLTNRRPWLPSALDSIFVKALAKDPTKRYATCGDVVSLISRVMRDVPTPELTGRRVRFWERHRPF